MKSQLKIKNNISKQASEAISLINLNSNKIIKQTERSMILPFKGKSSNSSTEGQYMKFFRQSGKVQINMNRLIINQSSDKLKHSVSTIINQLNSLQKIFFYKNMFFNSTFSYHNYNLIFRLIRYGSMSEFNLLFLINFYEVIFLYNISENTEKFFFVTERMKRILYLTRLWFSSGEVSISQMGMILISLSKLGIYDIHLFRIFLDEINSSLASNREVLFEYEVLYFKVNINIYNQLYSTVIKALNILNHNNPQSISILLDIIKYLKYKYKQRENVISKDDFSFLFCTLSPAAQRIKYKEYYHQDMIDVFKFFLFEIHDFINQGKPTKDDSNEKSYNYNVFSQYLNSFLSYSETVLKENFIVNTLFPSKSKVSFLNQNLQTVFENSNDFPLLLYYIKEISSLLMKFIYENKLPIITNQYSFDYFNLFHLITKNVYNSSIETYNLSVDNDFDLVFINYSNYFVSNLLSNITNFSQNIVDIKRGFLFNCDSDFDLNNIYQDLVIIQKLYNKDLLNDESKESFKYIMLSIKLFDIENKFLLTKSKIDSSVESSFISVYNNFDFSLEKTHMLFNKENLSSRLKIKEIDSTKTEFILTEMKKNKQIDHYINIIIDNFHKKIPYEASGIGFINNFLSIPIIYEQCDISKLSYLLISLRISILYFQNPKDYIRSVFSYLHQLKKYNLINFLILEDPIFLDYLTTNQLSLQTSSSSSSSASPIEKHILSFGMNQDIKLMKEFFSSEKNRIKLNKSNTEDYKIDHHKLFNQKSLKDMNITSIEDNSIYDSLLQLHINILYDAIHRVINNKPLHSMANFNLAKLFIENLENEFEFSVKKSNFFMILQRSQLMNGDLYGKDPTIHGEEDSGRKEDLSLNMNLNI